VIAFGVLGQHCDHRLSDGSNKSMVHADANSTSDAGAHTGSGAGASNSDGGEDRGTAANYDSGEQPEVAATVEAGLSDCSDDGGVAAALDGSCTMTSTVGDFDGGGARAIHVEENVHMPAPAACLENLSQDCDPTVYADKVWPLDCDGDGVTDHDVSGCDPDASDTLVWPARDADCAPNDPRYHSWILEDFDGDGYGVFGEINCSGTEVPPGFILYDGHNPLDCDDSSSDVFPGAIETWGDGVDADCVNGDMPDCQFLKAGGTLTGVAPELNNSCGGADLHFGDPLACRTELCGETGTSYLVVWNSGTAPPAPG
jgi:hypothetical protein